MNDSKPTLHPSEVKAANDLHELFVLGGAIVIFALLVVFMAFVYTHVRPSSSIELVNVSHEHVDTTHGYMP